MRKLINMVVVMAVLVGNVSLFTSNANAFTGYWQSTPSFNGGYTHQYHYSPYELLQKYSPRKISPY